MKLSHGSLALQASGCRCHCVACMALAPAVPCRVNGIRKAGLSHPISTKAWHTINVPKFSLCHAHNINTGICPVYVIASHPASPCSTLVGFLVPFVSSPWNILLPLISFYGMLALTRRILSSFHGLPDMSCE